MTAATAAAFPVAAASTPADRALRQVPTACAPGGDALQALVPGDDHSLAIQHNAPAAARQLSERNAVLRDAVAARKLTIQPLYFDLESGLTTLI